jgi:hypothetical protein
MTLRSFSHPGLIDYKYDTVAQRVISYKVKATGQPRAWSFDNSGIARMGLRTRSGSTVNIRRDQINQHLAPEPRKTTVTRIGSATQRQINEARARSTDVFKSGAAVTNSLDLLKPDFEYVLFSVKNQCSQYFFRGTSVGDALRMFARRGEHIAPSDIRILNTRTNTVTELQTQVITTYVLAA